MADRKGSPKASRRGATKQRSTTLVLGENLEYRVMRYFMAQGYFVRRGIEIYTDQYLNRATDLDVIAVRFAPPFRHIVQIVECKSGGAGPLDRIFWLSGLRRFVGADHATLVRANTPWDIKDFARRNDVELLDMAYLSNAERALNIDNEYWPGLSDRSFMETHLADWNKALREESEVASLHSLLIGEFRWAREVASIRYIVFVMRMIVRLAAANPDVTLWRVMLTECFAHLTMFALFFAGRTLGLTWSDTAALARKELKYGTLDATVVNRMMRYAQKLTEQVLESLGVSGKRIDERDFDYPEGPHVEEIVRILEKVIQNQKEALALPAFADYVLSERYVKGRTPLPMLKAFTGDSTPNLISRLAWSICRELVSIEALPVELSGMFDPSGRHGGGGDSENRGLVQDEKAVVPEPEKRGFRQTGSGDSSDSGWRSGETGADSTPTLFEP